MNRMDRYLLKPKVISKSLTVLSTGNMFSFWKLKRNFKKFECLIYITLYSFEYIKF